MEQHMHIVAIPYDFVVILLTLESSLNLASFFSYLGGV
jgi:hypothetical protein